MKSLLGAQQGFGVCFAQILHHKMKDNIFIVEGDIRMTLVWLLDLKIPVYSSSVTPSAPPSPPGWSRSVSYYFSLIAENKMIERVFSKL